MKQKRARWSLIVLGFVATFSSVIMLIILLPPPSEAYPLYMIGVVGIIFTLWGATGSGNVGMY